MTLFLTNVLSGVNLEGNLAAHFGVVNQKVDAYHPKGANGRTPQSISSMCIPKNGGGGGTTLGKQRNGALARTLPECPPSKPLRQDAVLVSETDADSGQLRLRCV